MFKRFVLLKFVVASALMAAATNSLAAQGSAVPGTPAACSKAIADWRTAQLAPELAAYRAATDANRAELQTKYLNVNTAAMAGSQAKAAECAKQFPVATIPGAQLMDLVSLLTLAKDTANLRAATMRLQTDNTLPPRVRAGSLMLAMNRAISDNSTIFGIIEPAESIVTQIDALPDSLTDIKLQAHTTMLGRYEYLDVANGLEKHALAIIALSKNQAKSPSLITAYQSLARSFADRLQPDSALRILTTGEKALGAPAVQQFADFRNRYQLIGKRAPTVDAAWWINTDAKKVTTPATGNVTLIEFTAHWCGPCKNSYPGLRSLAERFKGKPFTGVMVTQLYGYLGTQKNLNAEQEIAADKEYFGKEHALPFPVAVNPEVKQTAGSFTQPRADLDYRVGGIPQIMIVDKRGIIRQIVTGWDQGNTERFSALIEKLLAENP